MNKLPTTTESQRARLLDHLQTRGPITTLQARRRLDVLHPAARVQELREQGHSIETHWQFESTAQGRHRVAQYVLLTGEVVA